MRIQTILSEDFQPSAALPTVRFSDLNTLQIRTLQRLANGEVDVDTASDKEYDIMADLVELGLLDQEYQLTKRGQNAVILAKQRGGSQELQDARKRAAALAATDAAGGNVADVEVDDDEFDDTTPVGDEDEDEFNFDIDTSVQRGMPSDRGRLNF